MEDKKIIENDSQLIVGVNEKISCGKAAFLGMQHVLSMDLYIMPLILGAAIGLVGGELSFFLQMSFLCMWNCNYIAGGILHEVPYHTGTIVCTAWSYVYDRRDHGSQCNDRKSDTRSNHDRIAGYI